MSIMEKKNKLLYMQFDYSAKTNSYEFFSTFCSTERQICKYRHSQYRLCD